MYKRTFILILLCRFIYAGNEALIINADHRKTVTLNGDWEIIIDPYENGFYNYRYEENPNGYFKNLKPESERDLIEYEFNSSNTLAVPGDWNSQKTELIFYTISFLHKKSFDYSIAG